MRASLSFSGHAVFLNLSGAIETMPIKKSKKGRPYEFLYWIIAIVGAILILVNLVNAIVALIGVVLLYAGLKYVGVIKA